MSSVYYKGSALLLLGGQRVNTNPIKKRCLRGCGRRLIWFLSQPRINKNYLKNVFKKYFKDDFIWQEIAKMFECKILDISTDEMVYSKANGLGKSLLSAFLLNLYLRELDDFIYSLIIKCVSKKKVLKCFFDNSNHRVLYPSSVKDFFPLRLEKTLQKYTDMKYLIFSKYVSFYNNFTGNKRFFFRNFEKSFRFVRYLDFIILGFVSDFNFVFFTQRKVIGFINSHLHFDVIGTKVFSYKEKNIVFLGYLVKLASFESKLLIDKLKANKKYFLKVMARIDKNYRKAVKATKYRIYSELISHINSILTHKAFLCKTKTDKRIWNLVFQLESIRVTQYGTELFSEDKQDSISRGFIEKFKGLNKSNNLFLYTTYNFNLYLLKIQKALQNTLSAVPSFLGDSILPVDLVFFDLFSEFKKKIFLVFNNFSYSFNYNELVSKVNFSFLTKALPTHISFFYGLNFFNYYAVYRRTSFNEYKVINFHDELCYNIFIPFDFLLKRLRLFGFIHPFKNRPIGNSKYLSRHDLSIIKAFGNFAFSLVYWYRFCKDFYKINYLVEIVRESCLLTLCRKHNKNRNWAYETYSSDLLLFQNLFTNKSFFPDKKIIIAVGSKNFKFTFKIKGFEEAFFLGI